MLRNYPETNGDRSFMGYDQRDFKAILTTGLGLARPPFSIIGIPPFLLGTILAWRLERLFNPVVFILSFIGIALVITATHLADEYYSCARGNTSHRLRAVFGRREESSLFSSRRSDAALLKASLGAMCLAFLLAGYLQFFLGTGPYTMLLGGIGVIPSILYFFSPPSVMKKGIGEVAIAFCYSWLPLIAAYYLQSGHIPPFLHQTAVSIGLSTFNVVMLSCFHLAPGSAEASRSLLAWLGKAKGASLYILLSLLSWLSVSTSHWLGVPRKALYLYLPVLFLSAASSFMMARGKYENPLLLELIGGMNIAVNLGTPLAYLLAFL